MTKTTVKSTVQGAVDKMQEVFGHLVDSAKKQARRVSDAATTQVKPTAVKAKAKAKRKAPATKKRAASKGKRKAKR
jgi:uncharacterized protein YjbJ (UPF0337 family)